MATAAHPPYPTGPPPFAPTHVVPPHGLPSWTAPDGLVPAEPLDALLPVTLRRRSGDWGEVECANGWTTWVDARLLVPLPQAPPAAGQEAERTADARELLARVERTLGHYRRAVEDLASGRLDGETFRGRTRGLRIGAVVDGDALWLYDADADRWCYCDGTALTVLAATSPPGGAP
ncbi:hypothetical protein ACFP1Z_16010 [Streptomyces gamaensis]|uniref:SH3 domain-containing protein n=1 Tax=Streptomyces gamaensis TaxID=1763542 RepID=A0ABW0YZS6_9ACTN